jgi:DNA-binding response OmpR family regulator
MIRKILVVDYSELRQQMYRMVLSRYQCACIEAVNGRAALDLLITQPDIDLVLLDINIAMAGMTGQEFLAEFARIGVASSVPLILIGAAEDEEEVCRGLEQGASEVLYRPFNPSRLHEIIEKICVAKKAPETGKETPCRPEVVSPVTQEVPADKIFWRGSLAKTESMALGGELLSALSRCDTLTVNLDGVKFLDYSCLVLLCAVKRQASEKGKEIRLEGTGNRAVAPLIQGYPVNGSRLCRAYCGNSCLFD